MSDNPKDPDIERDEHEARAVVELARRGVWAKHEPYVWLVEAIVVGLFAIAREVRTHGAGTFRHLDDIENEMRRARMGP